MQNDAAEKRLFNSAVEAIDYYCSIRPPTPIESVFLWLAQLSPFTDPSIDSNRTKSKSLSDNYSKSNSNISDGVGGEEIVIEKELVTEEELVTKEKLVTEEELMTEEELLTEKKLEMEEEIETEDLKGLE